MNELSTNRSEPEMIHMFARPFLELPTGMDGADSRAAQGIALLVPDFHDHQTTNHKE